MADEPESPEATHQANPPSTTPLAMEKIPQTREKNVNDTQEAQNEEPPKLPMLAGWRLGVLTTGYVSFFKSEKENRRGTANKGVTNMGRYVRLCLCVFLSALDITIVSTSLAAISNDLDAFEQSSWIVSSYLTTYFSKSLTNPTASAYTIPVTHTNTLVGFLIIWARLSDLIGRKLMLMIAIVLFLAFSAACGGGQTALQM